MRPSSLVGVLLDFLDVLDSESSQPADLKLSKFFRERRFLGSRDRRFVGDAAYAFLRHGERGRVRWRHWLERSGMEPDSEGRVRHLGALLAIAADGLFPWPAAELADAAATFAAASGGRWTEVLERVRMGKFLDASDWPDESLERLAAELSLPVWLAERLVEERGEDEARRLGEALLETAPVDLRVNTSTVEREVVRHDLEKKFTIQVGFTPYSPCGLRLRDRVNLRQFLSRHPGWAELQDEGSQIAAAAAGVRAGDTVIDACAGGGGKTLAFADATGGEGKFHVCDIDAEKMSRLMRRTEPLGLRSLTPHAISPAGALPPSLPSRANVVVCDVPCSGLGSLRRNPDLKSRYGPEDIAAFGATQLEILERFAPRVRPGGTLVYITCSILAQENEDVAEQFGSRHSEYAAEKPTLDVPLPAAAWLGPYLRLDPLATGTDGFFVARWRRHDDATR